MSLGKILIIDDKLDIQVQMKDALEDVNYEVLLAFNTQEARSLLRDENFDLIFMDIWLDEGQDGMSFLEELVNNKFSTPIIMMSGHADHNDVVKAFKLGAVDFIKKPFLNVASIVRDTLTKITDESSNLVSSSVFNLPIKEARNIFEKNYLTYHLGQNGNNIAKVAEKIGLERTTLYRKLKDLGIDKS